MFLCSTSYFFVEKGGSGCWSETERQLSLVSERDKRRLSCFSEEAKYRAEENEGV